LPQIFQIQKVKAAVLFAEGQFQQRAQPQNALLYLPLILVFILLSFYQAKSYYIAGIFLGGLVGSFLLLGLMGYVLFFILIKRFHFRSWTTKYSIKSLTRRKFASVAVFVSLGLGALLLNLLPQLKTSLLNEFSIGGVSKVPSLFLFDIQEEQLPLLQKRIDNEKLQFIAVSPLIRTRIIDVNGEAFERKITNGEYLTREEEAEVRFRNRGANISIRSEMSDSETLMAGVPFSGTYDALKNEIAELSVEYRYAQRLKIKLGDLLRFDVQGVEFVGRIVNLRKVKWTSFQPNFFILVQPGVLEDAPKTYIAALPRVSSELRADLQRNLAAEFPNISIIDVERLVKEILKVADQMSWSLQFMSALCLLLGYTILFSMIRSQIQERQWEINLLKILGSSPKSLFSYLSFEYLVLSLMAAFVGSFLSVGLSFGLSYFIFESVYSFEVFWPVLSIFFVVTLSLLLCWFLTRKVTREKPLGLLKT
jgi:putative ABC transport system permease protein